MFSLHLPAMAAVHVTTCVGFSCLLVQIGSMPSIDPSSMPSMPSIDPSSSTFFKLSAGERLLLTEHWQLQRRIRSASFLAASENVG